MNCVIVDDDVSKNILSDLIKQLNYLTLVKACSNPLDALETLNNEKIDILFLNIEMPDMKGVELLKKIKKRPHVILTTTHVKNVFEISDLTIADYLVKPINPSKFMQAMAKIRK